MFGNFIYAAPQAMPIYSQMIQPFYYPIMMIPIPQMQQPNQEENNSQPSTQTQNKVEQPHKNPSQPNTQATDSSQQDSESNFEEDKYIIQHTKKYEKPIREKKVRKSNTPNLFKESTNYQKNYAKALVIYAQKQVELIIKLIGSQKAQDFFGLLSSMKNKIRNISHIRNYTTDHEMLRLFRILGYKFQRKECVAYIYNSKIQQKTNHLKRKYIIKKALVKI